MDTVPSHESIIRRAAEHMIDQHGRHAADFADYRSRELRATGNIEAAALWSDVAERIRERPGDALLARAEHLTA